MFDSHAHYDDRLYDDDREELLGRLFGQAGVTGVVAIGCDLASSRAAVSLAETHGGMYAAVGLHPEYAEALSPALLAELEEMLRLPKVVALGEIGLDYHYDTPSRDAQKAAFRAQLTLAEKRGMPVSVHDRDAHGDVLAILKEFPGVTGVLHAFSGSVEFAKELVKMGWYVSFSGVLTFKNARQMPEVAARVPADRYLVETDAPYLTPFPHRGERNDSGMLRYTLQKLAEVRGVPFETAERETEENARRLFRIES